MLCAPQVGKGNVAAAFSTAGRASVARWAKAKVAEETFHEKVLVHCFAEFAFLSVASGVFDDKAISFPSLCLVAELDTANVRDVVCMADFIKITFPDPRTWCSMAGNVNGLQIVVFLAQESLEACNLARCAAEKDLFAFFQEFLGYCIAVAYAALHVFAAAQSAQVIYIVNKYVLNLPVLVERRSKDDAIVVYCCLGELCEDSAR